MDSLTKRRVWVTRVARNFQVYQNINRRWWLNATVAMTCQSCTQAYGRSLSGSHRSMRTSDKRVSRSSLPQCQRPHSMRICTGIKLSDRDIDGFDDILLLRAPPGRLDLSTQRVETCDAPRPMVVHALAHQPLIDQRCNMVVRTSVRNLREFRNFVYRSPLVVHDHIHNLAAAAWECCESTFRRHIESASRRIAPRRIQSSDIRRFRVKVFPELRPLGNELLATQESNEIPGRHLLDRLRQI